MRIPFPSASGASCGFARGPRDRLASLLVGGTILGTTVLLAGPLGGQAVAPSAPATSPTRFSANDALDVVSYVVQDLTGDGRWIAATSATRRDGLGVDFRRDGDPTYVRPATQRAWVIDAQTGAARALFPDKRNVAAMRWSPDGARLALLVRDARTGDFVPMLWDRSSGRFTSIALPADRYVAESAELRWSASGARLLLTLHRKTWRTAMRDSFALFTAGPVFVQSSSDPFLSWEALRRSANARSVVAYDVASAKLIELLPETMLSSWNLTDDGALLVTGEDITRKTDYDVIFGSESKLVARPASCAAGGSCATPRVLMPTLKGTTIVWSPDGSRYVYGKEGRVYVASLADAAPKLIAGPPERARDSSATADTSKEARERRDRERFTPLRYSPRNDAVLLSNREGLWLVELATGARERIAETSDSNVALPRITPAAWTDDGRYLYFTSASRQRWERGVLRYDRQARRMETLARDGRSYSNLRVSKNGSTVVLSVASGNRPAEPFVADAALTSMRRLVDANPQLATVQFGPTDLITYLDADGHPKYGVVYYPAGYERGRSYPTIFIVYEDFFDDSFDATANVFAANGYVVVKPSVDFDVGYPGEAWVKGVTAAANKLIEMGVADSARLGVQGTSYGGYATNLLVTQTNRFRAAINISGKVDVISFYTDSPRLGVRNVHAAEKSQDRLGATLWQQPQKYVQQSAIMFADRIQTPLMLITGAQDSNVPADNTREMYFALRRLGKEVVWVNYMNGGHGGGTATADDVLDMHRRMLAWYDAKLKRAPGKIATAQ